MLEAVVVGDVGAAETKEVTMAMVVMAMVVIVGALVRETRVVGATGYVEATFLAAVDQWWRQLWQVTAGRVVGAVEATEAVEAETVVMVEMRVGVAVGLEDARGEAMAVLTEVVAMAVLVGATAVEAKVEAKVVAMVAEATVEAMEAMVVARVASSYPAAMQDIDQSYPVSRAGQDVQVAVEARAVGTVEVQEPILANTVAAVAALTALAQTSRCGWARQPRPRRELHSRVGWLPLRKRTMVRWWRGLDLSAQRTRGCGCRFGCATRRR